MTIINKENLAVRHAITLDHPERPLVAGVRITQDFTESCSGSFGCKVTNPEIDIENHPGTLKETICSAEVVLTKKAVEKAMRNIPKSQIAILENILVIKGGKEQIGLLTTDLESTDIVQSLPIKSDSPYPNTQEVYPTTIPVIIKYIALEQLEVLVKVLKDFKPESPTPRVKFSFWQEEKTALTITAKNEKGQELTGFIMTCRP